MLPRMDDPTGELRRQRELIAAHLRWLDEQIARTQGTPPPPPSAPSIPVPAALTPATPSVGDMNPPHTAAAAMSSSAIPETALPEVDPGSIRNEVRRGCFIYVAIITLLLAASIAVAVWIARSY
jgi:hypothetical protein